MKQTPPLPATIPQPYKILPALCGTKFVLTCSQQAVTCLCDEPDQSTLRPLSYFCHNYLTLS